MSIYFYFLLLLFWSTAEMRIIMSLSTYYKIYYKEMDNRILQTTGYDLIRTTAGTNTTRQAAPIVLTFFYFQSS